MTGNGIANQRRLLLLFLVGALTGIESFNTGPLRIYERCLREMNAVEIPEGEILISPMMKTVHEILMSRILDIGACKNVQYLGLDCSTEDILAAEAILKLYYGRCMDRINLLPTPAHPPPLDNQATKCAAQVFPGLPLAMALPPSDYSQQMLGGMAADTQAHVNAMETFCSNVSAFVTCIKEEIDSLPWEGPIYAYDIRTLETTLSSYCSKQDLISSQFQCTYEAVVNSHCGGGLMDVLYMYQLSAPYTSITCRRTLEALRCRIQELRKCSEEYALAMTQFYRDLKPDCTYIPSSGSQLGTFLACSERLYHQLVDTIMNAEGARRNPNKMLSVGMDFFCSKRSELVRCEEDAYDSDNLIDKVITSALRPENFGTMLNSICSVAEDLKEHAFCIVMEVQRDRQNENCTYWSSRNLEKSVLETMTWGYLYSEQQVEERIPNVCTPVASYPSCIRPAVQKCSPRLAAWFDELTEYFTAACGSDEVVTM